MKVLAVDLFTQVDDASAEQNICIIPVMNKDTKDESSSFKDS